MGGERRHSREQQSIVLDLGLTLLVEIDKRGHPEKINASHHEQEQAQGQRLAAAAGGQGVERGYGDTSVTIVKISCLSASMRVTGAAKVGL